MAGLSDEELARRYAAGDESVLELAEAAGMSPSGLQRRLRRIGVPPRRSERTGALDASAVSSALSEHRSVRAAAAALGISRPALVALARRHGLAEKGSVPAGLVECYREGASVAELARAHGVSTGTISYWLRGAGLEVRPRGRPPRSS
jgi:transcriptional regulator with XRE-family HTH domain